MSQQRNESFRQVPVYHRAICISHNKVRALPSRASLKGRLLLRKVSQQTTIKGRDSKLSSIRRVTRKDGEERTMCTAQVSWILEALTMVGIFNHLGAIRRRTHGILKEFGSIPSILCLFSDSNGILKQLKGEILTMLLVQKLGEFSK